MPQSTSINCSNPAWVWKLQPSGHFQNLRVGAGRFLLEDESSGPNQLAKCNADFNQLLASMVASEMFSSSVQAHPKPQRRARLVVKQADCSKGGSKMLMFYPFQRFHRIFMDFWIPLESNSQTRDVHMYLGLLHLFDGVEAPVLAKPTCPGLQKGIVIWALQRWRPLAKGVLVRHVGVDLNEAGVW